jgi:hypothetical protein
MEIGDINKPQPQESGKLQASCFKFNCLQVQRQVSPGESYCHWDSWPNDSRILGWPQESQSRNKESIESKNWKVGEQALQERWGS